MNFLGDFSRWTFDPRKRFTRVLEQQGRARIDADGNEQSAIFLHHLRALAEDIGGPYFGPMGDTGFRISPVVDNGLLADLTIHPGVYYAHGVRCENRQEALRYTGQPGVSAKDLAPWGRYLVYLEAWERHVSYIEDPGIREVALGGADTAVRAELAWQVRIRAGWELEFEETRTLSHQALTRALRDLGRRSVARLAARAGMDQEPGEDPCEQPAEAGYRGPENQLYRVEIHRGGDANQATFKWSRDNGLTFPVARRKGAVLTLANLGRDARMTLEPADWVEVLDDRSERLVEPPDLVQVVEVDPERYQVILDKEPGDNIGSDPALHPRLRRWNHRAGEPEEGGAELQGGAVRIREGDDETAWIELEDGIGIRFQSPGDEGGPTVYRPGDYWWIPARTATGDVEWPTAGDGAPAALEPHGVERFYAPLAIVERDEGGMVVLRDTRWVLDIPRRAPDERG